uniref:NADH-ubiquinone oxidoreductase chain 1 n=1 Tax=Therophilus festivus TaxID=1421599 RepID=A0A0A6ZKX5_9HYME|nr:NADH dehydrogenase subunit 1 [Therophilus festivus]
MYNLFYKYMNMQNLIYIFIIFLMLILVMIMIMISVAFFTLFERKIMGIFHYRKGPNKISLIGLMQPFSDAMKLLMKEFFLPLNSNLYLYLIMPIMMLILILLTWMIYPFLNNLLMWKFNILYFLCLMSLGVYSIMLGGWSSNSSLSMIGSIRSIAQSISYEVIFSISLLLMLMMLNSLNFFNFMNLNLKLIFMLYPNFLILLISMLAEINRTPFDLSEGESELVSGFNIEYSSSNFTLIFLSEYASIMMMMFMLNFIFLYYYQMNLIFFFNFIFMIYFITWIRMLSLEFDLMY